MDSVLQPIPPQDSFPNIKVSSGPKDEENKTHSPKEKVRILPNQKY